MVCVCVRASVKVMRKYLCKEAGVPKDGIRGRQTEAAGNERYKPYASSKLINDGPTSAFKPLPTAISFVSSLRFAFSYPFSPSHTFHITPL